VKINSATQPVAFQYGPPSSGHLIPFVHADEGEFYPLLFSYLFDTAVQVAFHSSELKLATVLMVEADMPFSGEVNEILVPLLHFKDAPFSGVLLVLFFTCCLTYRRLINGSSTSPAYQRVQNEYVVMTL
jgi:hypothetical protein